MMREEVQGAQDGNSIDFKLFAPKFPEDRRVTVNREVENEQSPCCRAQYNRNLTSQKRYSQLCYLFPGNIFCEVMLEPQAKN